MSAVMNFDKKERQALVAKSYKTTRRTDLAKRFGVSVYTIHNDLREMGAERREYFNWTDENRKTTKEMYLSGYTRQQIAAAIGHPDCNAIGSYISNFLKLRRERGASEILEARPHLRETYVSGGVAALEAAVAAENLKADEEISAIIQAGERARADLKRDVMAGDATRRAKILALREAGITLEECGSLFGITRERVRQIQANEPKRGSGAKRGAKVKFTVDQALEAFSRVGSIKLTAEDLGCSYGTARNLLSIGGAKLRNHHIPQALQSHWLKADQHQRTAFLDFIAKLDCAG